MLEPNFEESDGLGTSRCKKNQINFEIKNFPAYDNDSNANFENLLKQEIANVAICYFSIFSSFQKLIFKYLKNEIRQNPGICHNGAFAV